MMIAVSFPESCPRFQIFALPEVLVLKVGRRNAVINPILAQGVFCVPRLLS